MTNNVCIYLVVVIAILFSNVLLGDGRRIHGGSKGILKTIKTEDGEVIDCVDIYKQPAFSHPLLLNHTIQLEPSFGTTSSLKSQDDITQSWHKNGQCPQGSIPIVRNGSPSFNKKFPPFSDALMTKNNDDSDYVHQWALVFIEQDGQIQGGHAKINNWRPFANEEGGSMSQIWIAASSSETHRETIEVGWMVAPSTGSSDPKLFIYWTNDNYNKTGCYNLDCPGFLQTNLRFAIGAKLAKISTYGGEIFETEYNIQKDPNSNVWWLTINGQPQGYWPAELFTKMSQNADVIGWGGEVVDRVDYKNPTHMGNGRGILANGSHVHQMKYYADDEDAPVVSPDADALKILETYGTCYGVGEVGGGGESDDRYDQYASYGGPGCPQ